MLKSKRNISERTKILIDTSFILPALGIDVEDEIYRTISHFRQLDIYYIEIEILEAMWKILKIVDRTKLSRILLGLESIKRTYKLIEPPSNVYIDAIKIYDKGHKDYIDALLYATAKNLNIPLLTMDYPFIEFLEKNNYEIKNVIITPKDLQ